MYSKNHTFVWVVIIGLLSNSGAHHGWAQENSSTDSGQIGLISVPSARFDKSGTLKIGSSFSDPYVHGFMGFQISDHLNITLRQSAETSDPTSSPDRFFPGVDFKLKLIDEDRFRPQISFGAQSAVGHKRMGGEYIAASKRYNNWDFTAGLGWGRYGSILNLDNPLKSLSNSHFGKSRSLDGDMPMQPNMWLTGDKIGLFGGAEYNVQAVDGLSLKFDVGADRYEAEKAAIAYNAATPWSAGVNYSAHLGEHTKMDTQIAVQGGDRISARITLSRLIQSLWGKPKMKRAGVSFVAKKGDKQDKPHMSFDNVTYPTPYEVKADFAMNPDYSLPDQLGIAADHMNRTASKDVQKISLLPRFLGLKGPRVSVMRHDVDNANAQGHGSSAEIWQNAEITPEPPDPIGWSWLSFFWLDLIRGKSDNSSDKTPYNAIQITLDQHSSLAEEDHSMLHRTSVLAKVITSRQRGGLSGGTALRLNLRDNLHHIEMLRPKSLLPVRSDVAKYANSTVSVDQAYLSFMHNITPNIYASFMSGYLEEMYAGTGGEILYRPYDKRFAIGAEAFAATKRDPDSDLDLSLTSYSVLTGQVNAYYDLPKSDLTLTASAGRFLGTDHGGKVGFVRRFDNGMRLSGHLTLSNYGDTDLYGGTTHSDHGLRLTMPLGGIKHVPDFVKANVKMQPFARDIGQSIHKPIDLYEVTDHFSLPHISRYWGDVVNQ